jgi:hypothetical protein
MDQQQRDDYLAKAKRAEERAIRSMEQSARESWLRIASSYSEMANRKGLGS